MIWQLGDVHGNFDHVLETVERTDEQPAAVVFLGDLECQRSFSKCVADIETAGIQCWAVRYLGEQADMGNLAAPQHELAAVVRLAPECRP